MTARRPPPVHLAAAVRLTTPEVAAALTRLQRAAHGAGDTATLRELQRVQVWLTATAAQARAAQRRQVVRCPHCARTIGDVGELHDLLHQLAVEL
jgi:hypothetical protein